jgi:hypothetical protein
MELLISHAAARCYTIKELPAGAHATRAVALRGAC